MDYHHHARMTVYGREVLAKSVVEGPAEPVRGWAGCDLCLRVGHPEPARTGDAEGRARGGIAGAANVLPCVPIRACADGERRRVSAVRAGTVESREQGIEDGSQQADMPSIPYSLLPILCLLVLSLTGH
jgi:hypothetical protein